MLRQAPILFFFLCFFLLVLHLQSCKVVVEDPYGNRIGDLDSLNWDSLLSSPGIIPGYSSWEWPKSSFIWPPFSSWNFSSNSSSSSDPALSSSSMNPSSSLIQSSSSSETDPSSSSSYDEESSSSITCDYFTIYTYQKDTLYSWKELYADDYEEVRIAVDTSAYPGSVAIPLRQANWYVPYSYLGIPSVGTEWICDDQEEYYQADSLNAIRRMSGSKDTVFLNYGPEAKDSIIPLMVEIPDKETLLLTFDTLHVCWMYQSQFNVNHFRGDSLRVTLLAPEWFSIPTPGQPSLDVSPINIRAIPDSTLVDTTTFSWQIRIKNRFGYRDQLRVSTVVIPSPTPGECP